MNNPIKETGIIPMMNNGFSRLSNNTAQITKITTKRAKTMEWQAQYFSSGGTLAEKHRAQAVFTAFNEHFQSLVETGIPGFICILSIPLFLFRQLRFRWLQGPQEEGYTRMLLGVLLTAGVSSLFMYTFHSPFILLLTVVCLALVQTSASRPASWLLIRSGTLFRVILFPVSAGIIWFVIQLATAGTAYGKWERLKGAAGNDLDAVARQVPQFDVMLKDNSAFLRDAGLVNYTLNRFPTAVDLLERSNRQTRSLDNYLKISSAYLEQKKFDSAAIIYEKVSNIVPSLLLPRYRLALLYHASGDVGQFRSSARTLLAMEEKVASPKGYAIKQEIQTFTGAI